MIKGIHISDLPRVFREALHIIHICNLEYLWIDSLCIIQDNDIQGRKLDWENEAVKIGDIYTGGVFNIAAIGSKNSDGTLFPEQKRFFKPVARDCFGRHGQNKEGSMPVRVLPDSDAEFERRVLSSELLSRGWVYQELILAPANLFCTPQQMWWLCHTGRYCQERLTATQFSNEHRDESATLSKGRDTIAKPRAMREPLEAWGELLRLYIKTSVTCKDDRLVAVAGLSKVFRSVYSESLSFVYYNSGFWSANIIFQLGWHTTSTNIAPNRYTADHFIPSWSPVSCKSEITYWWGSRPFQLPIECTMNTLGLDSFGRAKSTEQGILHLRGVPIEMTLGPVDVNGKVEDEVWPSTHPDLIFEVRWDNQEEMDSAAKESSESRLRALILTVSPGFVPEGILLRPFRDGDSFNPGKWARCGYLSRPLHGRKQVGIEYMINAFQLFRYGSDWPMNERRFRHGDSAPDLEDIYLV